MSIHNNAGETTATTGTGTVTLAGAIEGLQTFANAGVVDGEQVPYSIIDGTDFEIGYGTYMSSGTTLSRDVVFDSSNAGSKVNLSGSAEVRIVFHTQAILAMRAPWNYENYQ